MERFTSPVVTVLALYGLWCASVNFGWLKMINLKLPNLQSNPIVKAIETQIKKDLGQGQVTPNPSPSATPSPSPNPSSSPLIGGGANIKTPFFSGEYKFKIGGNSNGKQPAKQPDNRQPNR